MSSPIELPDDVLFNIVKFLRPPDIFSVRKTCKRLQAITMDRHTVGNLERVLIRSCRLNNLWVNPSAKPVCKKVWSIDSSAYGGIGHEMEFVEIYQGRYLVLRHEKVILVFDLQTKHEIFRYNAPMDELFDFLWLDVGRNKIVDDNPSDFFLPFWTSKSTNMSSVKISRLGAVSIVDLPAFNPENVFHLSGNEFAIFATLQDYMTGSQQAVHFPSQMVYPLHSGLMIDYNIFSDPVFLPGGYVLVSFDFFDRPSDHHFELYRLSCHIEGMPLMPTHRGCFVCEDVDRVSLLSSDITLGDRSELTGRIWIFMHLTGGHNNNSYNGCLTFSEVSHRDSLHELQLTVHSAGKSRVRGKPRWLLCQVSIDSGEPLVCTGAQLDVDKIGMHSVEVSQGYLVTRELGGEINIVDLV
ncbi:hypothetical protein BDP27DRAFT_1334653 [Rhodocollybia butyracea]|uniref:F-box domain-containing protein n=1 Tax=Rhodocollybia butyracea TaxID=206335 RepID=A0A9P5U2P9_9AGAR|nr:hypothetical protein BDP27DRAFT_1334653 [Rhodocollybia butyracea]